MFHAVEVAHFSFSKPDKEENEDFVLLPTSDSQSNIVFAIADGVGSLPGASKASVCAINAVSSVLNDKDFSVELALDRAKREVVNLASSDIRYSQAATTLTLIQVGSKEVIIGHVGDCRAYVRKSNRLVQLTVDHTRYQELIDSGEHSARLLRKNKARLSSVITRALSKSFDMNIDLLILPIEDLVENDSIVISMMTDGAYDHWHKRARFSQSTMDSPSAFINSLRKRIKKAPHDDFTCLNIRLER